MILLFALPAALGVLGVDGVLEPLQSMFDKLLSYVPNIAMAAATFAIGWVVSKIVQRVVVGLLVSSGIDDVIETRFAADAGTRSLSAIVGTLIVRVLIWFRSPSRA
ncbi:MAG: hypothetical protein R3A47_02130 [Polyangiales bacterium]